MPSLLQQMQNPAVQVKHILNKCFYDLNHFYLSSLFAQRQKSKVVQKS